MGLGHRDDLGEARRTTGHDPPGNWFREERGEPSVSHLSYLWQEFGVTSRWKAAPELLDSSDAGGAVPRSVVGLGVSKEKRLQCPLLRFPRIPERLVPWFDDLTQE